MQNIKNDTHYCCLVIKHSKKGFDRLKALLRILEADNYINFLSSKEKTRKNILKCLDEILEYRDSEIDGGICRIIYDSEEIEEYQTTEFADIIILQSDGVITHLHPFTFDNIDDFCNYMKDVVKAFENEVEHLYDDVFQDEFNEKINKTIDYYWDFIDYDYYYR